MLSESDPALSSSLKAVLTTKNGGESWICLTKEIPGILGRPL
jgi:hypothetical protein